MDDHLSVFTEQSEQYKLLQCAAIMLSTLDNTKHFFVKDCYFDYGQNWMYTTILAQKKNSTGSISQYQYLTARDQKELLDNGWENLYQTCYAIYTRKNT